MSNMRFSNRKLHFCFCFYVAVRETEKKQTMEKRPPKPIKIVYFKVVIQIWEKWRNGFLAEVAWHYVCQEGRKTRIFVRAICFGQKFLGPKTEKPGKTIKLRFQRKLPKWHFFGEKGGLGWKMFLLTVFLKSCVSENAILLCFQQNTAVAIKMYAEKQIIYENGGLFLSMAKWWFFEKDLSEDHDHMCSKFF